MYSININDSEFKKVDISYKTHPNMTLIDALTATTAFPILIPPLCLNGNCYVDGGLLNNLPINPLIEPDNNIIPSVSFNKSLKLQCGSFKLSFSR